MNFFSEKHFPFPSFFLLLFYSPINGGGGHGPLVHLSYSSNSGAAKICQWGQCEGAKRPSAGRVWEGGFPPPTVYREIFQNLCLKLAFSCTLDIKRIINDCERNGREYGTIRELSHWSIQQGAQRRVE